ncbi:hypothetical protein ACGFWD_44085 [Streptomyces sp. NPDC048448]|uniref:hypothetical protein n=1 Tax=Streptomyces sp. NPDC048448 TaxID=3365554 RepID=UPI0037181607
MLDPFPVQGFTSRFLTVYAVSAAGAGSGSPGCPEDEYEEGQPAQVSWDGFSMGQQNGAECRQRNSGGEACNETGASDVCQVLLNSLRPHLD